MKKLCLMILLSFLILILIAAIAIFRTKDIPFISMPQQVWSIGVATLTFENSRLKVTYPDSAQNPVLTAGLVTDRTATSVADPFLIRHNSNYYLFFEVVNSHDGDIGLATSFDGIHWKYEKIVLDEPYHLSYPAIIEANSSYYMTPEAGASKTIRLYKSSAFPLGWRFVKTIADGKQFADPTIFYWQNKYWLFASDTTNSVLYLYFADDLEGNWREHPQSPIIKKDKTRCRPAGAIIFTKDKIIRPAQDDTPYYGRQVRLFEIIKLTPNEYEERELNDSPILQATGSGWNKDGMHQLSACPVDSNQWLIAVDGKKHINSAMYIGKLKITLPKNIGALLRRGRKLQYRAM